MPTSNNNSSITSPKNNTTKGHQPIPKTDRFSKKVLSPLKTRSDTDRSESSCSISRSRNSTNRSSRTATSLSRSRSVRSTNSVRSSYSRFSTDDEDVSVEGEEGEDEEEEESEQDSSSDSEQQQESPANLKRSTSKTSSISKKSTTKFEKINRDVSKATPQNNPVLAVLENAKRQSLSASRTFSSLANNNNTSTNNEKITKKRKKAKVAICTSNTRYEVIRRVARKLNFKEVSDEDDWMLFWTDCSVSLDRVMNMKRYQKINHFPGMSEICRKDHLARNMNRLYKQYKTDYNIFPKTWVLPADFGDFQNYYRNKKGKCYIVKPEVGCQGRGIFVTKNPGRDIKPQEMSHMIVQQYISKPLLMDGYKFDLRVYVLVSSCDPLRIYVFNEGLVRLATVDYVDPTNANTEDVCMHLTNYAINKHSDNFVRPTGADAEDNSDASKRSFAFFNDWLDEMKKTGVHEKDRNQIWADIHDLINKTIITAAPILKHNYRTCFPTPFRGSSCFEILGFDVILDRKCKPWLLEVNHSPSFHTDSQLDRMIKTALITDTLKLLDLRTIDRKRCIDEDKKRVQMRLIGPKNETREIKAEKMKAITNEWLKNVAQYEETNISGFCRIYPPQNEEDAKKYKKYFNSSASLFQTTAAQRAREEASRIQLEELRMKNEIEQAKRQGRPIVDLLKFKRGESNIDSTTSNSTKLSSNRFGSPSKSNNNNSNGSNRKSASGNKFTLNKAGRVNRSKQPINILLPVQILDSEENERKFQMRQRASHIKSLGITDIVRKALDPNTNKYTTQKNHTMSAINGLGNNLDHLGYKNKHVEVQPGYNDIHNHYNNNHRNNSRQMLYAQQKNNSHNNNHHHNNSNNHSFNTDPNNVYQQNGAMQFKNNYQAHNPNQIIKSFHNNNNNNGSSQPINNNNTSQAMQNASANNILGNNHLYQQQHNRHLANQLHGTISENLHNHNNNAYYTQANPGYNQIIGSQRFVDNDFETSGDLGMSGVAYLKYKSNNTIPAQPPSIPTLQNAWRKQHNPHFALSIKQIGTNSNSTTHPTSAHLPNNATGHAPQVTQFNRAENHSGGPYGRNKTWSQKNSQRGIYWNN